MPNRYIEFSVIRHFSYFALVFHKQKWLDLFFFQNPLECLKISSWFLSLCYLWRLGYHIEGTRYFIMKEAAYFFPVNFLWSYLVWGHYQKSITHWHRNSSSWQKRQNSPYLTKGKRFVDLSLLTKIIHLHTFNHFRPSALYCTVYVYPIVFPKSTGHSWIVTCFWFWF